MKLLPGIELVPVEDREDSLEGMATKIEADQPYERDLTEAEVEDLRIALERQSLALSTKEAEWKEVQADWKGKLKALKGELGLTIHFLKNRKKGEKGNLYMIPDFEKGRMYMVNALGQILHDRPLLDTERQGNLYTLNPAKNGTED